uniref:Uncharacterized protein n=1 Tax=Nelumbo nucifera TaxID=4432 RepID=A0A822YLR6_NELNU|nr:TPA_asm: hypothetical protein HUJ06_011090 [Nelumbo nucifera]
MQKKRSVNENMVVEEVDRIPDFDDHEDMIEIEEDDDGQQYKFMVVTGIKESGTLRIQISSLLNLFATT